ncbi:LysM peptidoglycan-binding domain-containing protein [Paraburkholderia sp. CNPSo 3155]|uniref:LysM peptidoglycan-binding domain-containing protein n=1 Tax=Paraburkholderia atlantica TaxID=2654982 RepID=UPI00128D5171|nr:LysM peptidoglycan-binding domain-containing protein [Paraburkholderia atlantica]MPW05945.1 LysM peptidoglycan-binding domain-containing protein [Paraburkholderia atlantica]
MVTAMQAPARTGFERWQDGVSKAVSDARWNSWDCEIQMAVNEYNLHLRGTSGYVALDWQIIKAILWVETGAHDPQWNSKPMRIGVAGDPGLTSLLSGKEGGDLILPPAWKGRLTMASARTIPAYNIRAGIGYLLMRMARFKYRSVLGADPAVYEMTVRLGDSLDKMAKAQGTTIDTLKMLNSTATVLHPGQILKYRKASVQNTIASWHPISTALIAERYNGGGDINYARKLDYALPLVRKGKVALCVQ